MNSSAPPGDPGRGVCVGAVLRRAIEDRPRRDGGLPHAAAPESSFFSNARSTARTRASPRHLAREMDHADTSSVSTDHESWRREGHRSAPDAVGWTAAGCCSRACRKVICVRQGAASMPDSPRSCYSDRMRSTMPATKTAKGGAASRGCSNANSSQRSGRTRHPTPHQRLDWNARTKSQIQPTTIRRLARVLMGGLRARRPGVQKLHRGRRCTGNRRRTDCSPSIGCTPHRTRLANPWTGHRPARRRLPSRQVATAPAASHG